MNPKFLYHYTTPETLAKIKKDKRLKASVLENFLIKNNADKEELKHGLTIISDLVCNHVLANYEIEEDESQFRQRLVESINFRDVYETSISSNAGKWVILSLTENPENKYLSCEYSRGKDTKIQIGEPYFTTHHAENLIKVYYCDRIEYLSDMKVSEANDIAEFYCKLENCKKTTPEEQWKDLHLDFLKKVFRFAFSIKHTKFEKEEEVRFVLLLPNNLITVEGEEKYHYFSLDDEDFEIIE